jgi:Na+/H+ antiporter NhaD/arsenite permease-like protein
MFGMMVIVETLNLSGFFRWLGLHSARWVNLDPLRLFILFPFFSAALSAFMGSIVVMLFMATLTLEIGEITGANPLPLILSEIAASNIGGASTMVGDPPNLILGTHFNLSFTDFVANTGLIALIGLAVNTAFFIWFFRREILTARLTLGEDTLRRAQQVNSLNPGGAIRDKWLFAAGVTAALGVAAALATSSVTHLSVAIIALAGALLVLILGRAHAGEVLQGIDYSTLVFFAGLFIIVGAVEHVGLLACVAQGVSQLSGGNFLAALAILLWVSALGSSVVDNVPFAAAMAPLIGHLGGIAGFTTRPLVWATSLGTDIGGNGTPIGASANVVALAAYERVTGTKISWRYYCRVSFPAMVLVMLVCNLMIFFCT